MHVGRGRQGGRERRRRRRRIERGRVPSVVAQPQGRGRQGRGRIRHAVGGVEPGTGKRKTKAVHEGHLRHCLPHLGRPPSLLFQIRFPNVVQRV